MRALPACQPCGQPGVHPEQEEGASVVLKQLGLPDALAFALAAAPFRRQRPPPGAGALAGPVAGEGGVELGEAEGGGSSSTSSLAFSLPFLVVNVREADPPASFVCRSNFSTPPSILCSESEQKKMAEPKRYVLSLLWFQLNS